jgi:hypothetical protein
MTTNEDGLKARVEALVIAASSGSVTLARLNEADGRLPKAGFTSIMLMSLIELLEAKFGLVVSPTQDPEPLLSVAGIVGMIRACGGAMPS